MTLMCTRERAHGAGERRLACRVAALSLACATCERALHALRVQVQAARRAGVPVLHPDWLVACKLGWARQPEAAFVLPGYTVNGSAAYGGTRLLGPAGPASGPGRAAAEREKQAVMRAAGRAGG